jgi:hypothetical protein
MKNYEKYLNEAFDKLNEKNLKSIDANEYLEPGIKVSIGKLRGEVIKSILGKDQFGSDIYSYKIKCTEKYDEGNRKWKNIEPIIKTVNYASVYKLNESINNFHTFEQWEETAESLETIEVNRNRIRDVYKFPDGTTVYDDYVSPHNVFRPSFNYVVVDLIIKDNVENKELLKKYGGTIDIDHYTEDGFGMPAFKHETDALKNAYEFVKNEKDELLK